MLKVCIFGGGAIGGHIAAHLAKAGLCEVSLIARGSTLKAIQEKGLRVITPSEEFTVNIRASSDASELGTQDYLFLTLKAHQVASALEQIAPLIGPDTVIIPPTTAIPYYFFHQAQGPLRDRQMPAIDPHGKQWQALPPAQVLGCVYWIGAHVVAPGIVAQDGAVAGCPVGELDGSHSERAMRLGELLSASGIGSKINNDIRAAIWIKFVNSLCWNPVAVLTQATLGQMAETGDVVPMVRSMMLEADAVATALGLQITTSADKRIALTLNAPQHRMSMLQDLLAGRPLELDALDQSFRAVRALTDVATPVLENVLALARLRAASAV